MFHRHCVAMREEALAAEQAVAQSHTEPCGTIRIACPVTLAKTTVDWTLPPGIVHAVFPSRRGLVPAVRLFLDFLGEQLRDETPPTQGA